MDQDVFSIMQFKMILLTTNRRVSCVNTSGLDGRLLIFDSV